MMSAGLLREQEAQARRLLPADVCDFVAGGAGDERTLEANRAAFERRTLCPRVLVEVSSVSTQTMVLGTAIALPVLIAPIPVQRALHPGGEAATARGAAGAGTMMCVSMVSSTSCAELGAAASGPWWYQVYALRDRGATSELVARALAAGATALVVTVDAPRQGVRPRELRPGFRPPAVPALPDVAAVLGDIGPKELLARTAADLTWDDVSEMAARFPVPVVLKGVLAAEDARRAAAAGVAGVIVSNHGGRQLDRAPATADALPRVVDAAGEELEVLIDGGVRTGADVALALALGARATLVGRPAAWALAADGEHGVTRTLTALQSDLELTMTLLGCRSVAELAQTEVSGPARQRSP